jgi:3-hydroxy-9,10-secoandrosta-1,3,5(10)-triene-9,17-dione monooxygenase reductase component
MTAGATLENATAFRTTMSHLPTGVAIITTRAGEAPIGMTASAVSALSLNPLQLLVCIGNHLFTRRAISEHGQFGVNILGEGAEELALKFSSSGDRFAGVDYDDSHGVPMLRDAIASLVCDVATELPGGDHTIFVGSAKRFDHIRNAKPLVHFCGEFNRIA